VQEAEAGMSDCKFELSQIVFVIPIKMQGIIENCIKVSLDENTYEVGVMYQNRIWKATFYESELMDSEEDLS
jgi:hypothetical protein